jgi:hypothetical protein
MIQISGTYLNHRFIKSDRKGLMSKDNSQVQPCYPHVDFAIVKQKANIFMNQNICVG